MLPLDSSRPSFTHLVLYSWNLVSALVVRVRSSTSYPTLSMIEHRSSDAMHITDEQSVRPDHKIQMPSDDVQMGINLGLRR